jgi:hypothetical protein
VTLPPPRKPLHLRARDFRLQCVKAGHEGGIRRGRWGRWLVQFLHVRQVQRKRKAGLVCHKGKPKAQA